MISKIVAISCCHLLREVEETEPTSATRPNTPFLDIDTDCGVGAFLYKLQKTAAAVSWCLSSIFFINDVLVDRHSGNGPMRGPREAEIKFT